ncbi:RHS repeat domain-containing protein [Paraburkholderia rhizosphaerae]|uniref:RHS repeat domain-containing protein n=1 Tax=Paraburkholderia rhizosphaerae TaxID=480658 RepID=UPI00106523D0|nr:RHS repeat domain-containing protein [Paraburkholderia rhizosphaerae]
MTSIATKRKSVSALNNGGLELLTRSSRREVVSRKWCEKAGRSFRLVVAVALLTSVATAIAASSSTYTYDALGRLTKVVYTDGSKTSTVTYNYDAAGNRTSVVSTSPS